MAPSKQEGTAAAAQQLSSMSLKESAKRKDDDAEPAEKNGTTPTKELCSACGKESDALKKCTACKCVWYCDKKCQNKHRKEHKHECRRIKKELDKRGGKLDVGFEVDIGPLGKLPQREECPICMLVLPLQKKLHKYYGCCGKSICAGCEYQHQIKSGNQYTCAFCREPIPKTEKEYVAQLSKRVELKDPQALCNMGMYYGRGMCGLSVDQTKCIDLLRESASLGYPIAHYHLATIHFNGEMGLAQNKEEAFKYTEKAAEGGDLISRHNLGWDAQSNGDHAAAMHNYRMCASGGFRRSMEDLIGAFGAGLLHHADLAKTMQSFYRSRAEMMSKDRQQFIEHLKEIGEYEAEDDM